MSIPATTTLPESTRRTWDVVVIGAGPAGALAARESARRGLAVLLVDRAEFPRWKVCGSCLNLRSQSVLRSCGLEDLLPSRGAVPVVGMRLSALRWQAAVPLPGEMILSREAFDSALVEAAVQAGAHFLPRTQARLESVSEEMCSLSLRSPDGRPDDGDTTVHAKIVLAADGLGGTFLAGRAEVRPRIDAHARIGAGSIVAEFPNFYAEPYIYMACGRAGYVGLVRLEDGRLNLAAAFDPELVRRYGGLAGAAAEVLRDAGFPAIPSAGSSNWRGTPMLTRRVSPPARRRVFLLGDAAGYIEPFTGEGMAWALAAGAAIAPLAEEASQRWDDRLIQRWAEMHRRIVARRQWVCRTLAQLLRRPTLMRAAVGVMGRMPRLAGAVFRYVNGS